MSQLEVDKIIPQSGTTLTIGDSGDTITFADGAVIGIDTNTLYIDSTNNRVGIGTSSPASLLELEGTSTTAKIHISSTSAGPSSFDGSGAGLLLTAGGMNTTSKFTPAIQFGSTDPQLTTTNPKVGAAINAIAAESYTSDTDGGMDLAFYTTPNNPGTGQTTTERMRIENNGDISFYEDTGTTPKFFWDANAERLGIGTSSPNAALEVTSGDTDAIDIKTNGAIELSDAAAPSRAYTYLSRTASQSMVAGNMRFDESVTTGTHIKYAKGTDARAGSGIIFDNATSGYGSMLFVQNNDTGDDTWNVVERMRIDSSGNVGIGTSSPSSKLQVEQNQAASSYFDFLNTTNGGSVIWRQIVRNLADTGTTSVDLAKITGSGFVINNNDTGAANFTAFGVGASERMRIDSSGNLLVGTTSQISSAKLSVSGTIGSGALIINTGSAANVFTSYTNNGTSRFLVGLAATETGSNVGSDLYFNNYNDAGAQISTPMMIKRSNSYVGIGTISPSEKLDVSGNVTISGSLSKGSGSFKIDHPLPEKTDTHHLVHSFVEAPQADNIYRGKVDLVNGTATVNIDTVAGMSEGTFVLLNREVQCFTSNETGWTAIKGSVSDNILTITAQDETCADTISWLVIGERQDQHMYDTEWTDENGKVIVEPLKPVEEETINE